MLTLRMMLPLMPMTAQATIENRLYGWYYLRCMNNYLNIDAQRNAELSNLSQSETFFVETVGKNSTRIKAVNEPYTWLIYKYKNDDNVFSLRPAEAFKLVVNTSGEKNTDGTHVILWEYVDAYCNIQAPNHARFRFIPADDNIDLTGESWLVYEQNRLERC